MLKRLFMARLRVATAVLSGTEPTQDRYASAHERLAYVYGNADGPIFLKAEARYLTQICLFLFLFLSNHDQLVFHCVIKNST